MHGWYGAGGGGVLLMAVMMVLFWSAIVLLGVYGVYLARSPFGCGDRVGIRDSHGIGVSRSITL